MPVTTITDVGTIAVPVRDQDEAIACYVIEEQG